jgi:ADP-ribose pyrophosphatase YjhB (NUDIX family)
MNVKVRAVILEDDRLVVTRESRQGREHFSLPGGRVKRWERLEEALVREVQEETGLVVKPLRLLYAAEVTRPFRIHDVVLVFLAEPDPGIDEKTQKFSVELNAVPELPLRPPILELIASDSESGWKSSPRWLGNMWTSDAAAGPDSDQ